MIQIINNLLDDKNNIIEIDKTNIIYRPNCSLRFSRAEGHFICYFFFKQIFYEKYEEYEEKS